MSTMLFVILLVSQTNNWFALSSPSGEVLSSLLALAVTILIIDLAFKEKNKSEFGSLHTLIKSQKQLRMQA